VVNLTAGNIVLPGLISDGGGGAVTLTATTGNIDQTGTLIAGTLSGLAAGNANFSGPTNQVATLGDFSASAFALNDSTDLSIAGVLNAATVTLVSAGSIGETGALIASVLTGSAAGSADLTGGGNVVSNLIDFTAGSTFALTDATSLAIGGTLAAPRIVIDTGASQIILADGAQIVTGGNARPPGSTVALPTATNNPSGGAYLSAGGFTQLGNGFVSGVTGGANILRIDVAGAGNITFDQNGGLHGPDTWLVLGIGSGQATGSVFTRSLDVLRNGGGGGSGLSGSIGGVTGQAAASAAGIQPSPNSAFRFNGCPIATISCVQFTVELLPQGSPLNDIDISTLSNPDEQGDLLLPIVSDQDY
jgi:hypothetical protein